MFWSFDPAPEGYLGWLIDDIGLYKAASPFVLDRVALFNHPSDWTQVQIYDEDATISDSDETTLVMDQIEFLTSAIGATDPFLVTMVFDGMDALHLRFTLLEVDWYPRMGVHEYIFDAHEALLSFDQQVTLEDQIVEVQNEYVRLRLGVEVFPL